MNKDLRNYYEELGLKFKKNGKIKKNSKKRAAAMLDRALDTRKFEIELYWKRAGYFWALIGVAFAGYFAILSIDDSNFDRFRYSFIIACIGLLFSVAWHLVNKGSKYWQENWENHVCLLEDLTLGALYKSVLRRPNEGDAERLNLTVNSNSLGGIVNAPSRYSVSKINMCVSAFTVIVWIGLIAIAANFSCQSEPDYVKFSAGGITFICLVWMIMSLSKAHTSGHTPIGFKQKLEVYFS